MCFSFVFPPFQSRPLKLRPCLVGLLNLFLLLQKPKAKLRAQKTQLLLPKSSFSTRPAFGLNIYPPATGYDGYWFVFISSFPVRVASFFSYPCHEEVRAQ